MTCFQSLFFNSRSLPISTWRCHGSRRTGNAASHATVSMNGLSSHEALKAVKSLIGNVVMTTALFPQGVISLKWNVCPITLIPVDIVRRNNNIIFTSKAVAMSFWRNSDVIITRCVHREWTHDVIIILGRNSIYQFIITSLLRQSDVTTSFRRNKDVINMLRVSWAALSSLVCWSYAVDLTFSIFSLSQFVSAVRDLSNNQF